MDAWNQLFEECKVCTACELHKTRTNCVFGTGNPQADLLFVGEAPGEQEDLSGIPFVGRAGQLLDKYLYAVDIPRESVYIANILKCRPPKNRDPLPAEEDACIEFLRRQVRLIQPKIIVCLGRISAMRLIRPDYKITKEHGQWVERGGFLMTAVYHPALLLRDPRKKEEMLIDMKEIKARLDAIKREETL
ncbi:MAG: uracil-DNA glycosylase [Clostridia bacterium]|nr:uracil-DNA glycosylase [Clostridia bacterium]